MKSGVSNFRHTAPWLGGVGFRCTVGVGTLLAISIYEPLNPYKFVVQDAQTPQSSYEGH